MRRQPGYKAPADALILSGTFKSKCVGNDMPHELKAEATAGDWKLVDSTDPRP